MLKIFFAIKTKEDVVETVGCFETTEDKLEADGERANLTMTEDQKGRECEFWAVATHEPDLVFSMPAFEILVPSKG